MTGAQVAVCIAIILGAAPVWAASDSRLRTAQYSVDAIFRLHGQPGFQIDIEFERGEVFMGLGTGDLAALAYFAQDNHLFIKPKVAQVTTNLTVLTNRRQYQFDYTTLGHNEGPMYALRFSYPPSFGSTSNANHDVQAAMDMSSSERTHNADYWYCGSPSLMPESVWDDGVHTWLRWSARAEQPAVFVRNDDGGETLLNFSMHGDELVVQRVAHQFVLRRGALRGCVVNKTFGGAGERLPSGTVSPAVERTVSGGAQ